MEFLVVGIILGILAVIVVPQFTEATGQSDESTLACRVQTIRAQLELYKVQHMDQYPNVGGEMGDFVRRLTDKTDQEHAFGGVFGPYFQQFPINPFNGSSSVRIDGPPPGANTDGWRFDSSSGKIVADDSKLTPDGKYHFEL